MLMSGQGKYQQELAAKLLNHFLSEVLIQPDKKNSSYMLTLLPFTSWWVVPEPEIPEEKKSNIKDFKAVNIENW